MEREKRSPWPGPILMGYLVVLTMLVAVVAGVVRVVLVVAR